MPVGLAKTGSEQGRVMSLLLIDDQGEIWQGDSRKLREAFDSPFSGGEFVEYAIKNLGFVAVNVYGTSCQIRFRPDFLGNHTISSLKCWIEKSRAQRIVMSHFESGWQDVLVLPAVAVGKLNELMERRHFSKSGDFLSQNLAIGALKGRQELRDIVESWPNLIANYDAEVLLRLAKFAVDYRYAVVKRSDSQGKLVFDEISDRIYCAFDTWRECAVGAPIEEQPDRTFGKWVANAYYDTFQSDEPRFDAVDAIVQLPGDGRSRRRYRRLIFPVPSKKYGTLLVGGSIIDQAIDLRVTAR
ncbi:MAG: hypothetical protein AB7O57_15950 [Hyphomicrobiaceae bacterium]